MPSPGLGAKVKNTLVGWVSDVLSELGEAFVNIGTAIAEGILFILKAPTEWAADRLQEVVENKLGRKLYPGEFFPERGSPGMLEDLIIQLSRAIGFIAAIGFGMVGYWSQIFVAESQAKYPANVIPPDELILQLYRGQIEPQVAKDELSRNGFSEEWADRIIEARRPRNAPDEYLRMWLRGESMEGGIDDKLAELGFPEDEINILKTLAHYIPAVPDLVRMAVREAFTPEIVERYQLHADFPPEFAEWAERVGVSEEWAKNFWAAHWELPSITMAFEMLHRGIITDEELATLLRTLDVMPYWRDKITAVAYRPYSRVDVRRMYGVGVLDEAAVKRSYLDLGYDNEKAENMTAFTLLFGKSAERDLTKAELLRGYREGILDEATVNEALIDMGYDADEATFYIALEDVKKADALTKFKIDLGVTRYRAGDIDINELRGILGQLNLPAEQQDLIIEREQLKDTVKETLPTREDVTRWFHTERLDETDARQYLSTMGYSDILIDLYLIEQEKAPTGGTTLRWLVKGLIDEGTARSYLKDARYGDAEIDLLIMEATDLAPALEKLPPIKAIQTWYLTELITVMQAEEYLRAYGYADSDITLFITEWTPKPEEVKPRLPSIKTVGRWFVLDIVTEAETVDYLDQLGYVEPEVSRYLDEWTPTPAEIELRLPGVNVVGRWYKKAVIEESGAREYLVSLGFAAREVDRFMAEWAPEEIV